MVDPIHRSQLIQSLCKAPYMKADFLHHIINGKTAEETKNTESNIRVSFSVFFKTFFILVNIRIKIHWNILISTFRPHFTIGNISQVQYSRNPSFTTPNRSNIPDPTLFPYLSRHLASNSDLRDSPDVDAATAMLALGQTLNLPSNDIMTQNQQWTQPIKKDYSLKKNRPNSGPNCSEEHNIGIFLLKILFFILYDKIPYFKSKEKKWIRRAPCWLSMTIHTASVHDQLVPRIRKLIKYRQLQRNSCSLRPVTKF